MTRLSANRSIPLVFSAMFLYLCNNMNLLRARLATEGKLP
jgi:hypothetical protein